MDGSAFTSLPKGLITVNKVHFVRWFLPFIIVLCVSACSGRDQRVPYFGPGFTESEAIITDDLALLGVTRKSGADISVNPALMNSRLEELFAGRGDITATRVSSTRETIGRAPHDEMMAFYARHGRFKPYQIQRLMAAGLPARYALAARVESDTVDRMPVQRQNLTDDAGRVFADRERRIYVTRRTTSLSATLLDMRNGRVIWTRQYRTSPESVSVSNHFTGESFSASVAAAVADTIVNGARNSDYPPAPLLQDSLQVLLQEVVYKAPLQ